MCYTGNHVSRAEGALFKFVPCYQGFGFTFVELLSKPGSEFPVDGGREYLLVLAAK